MSLKISKIFAIPLIFSSFLFDTNNEFNKVNANVKNSPANKNDLDLYHGMGVSFLCNATRKGFDLDFPKTLNVASSTFASVISQKHGGKIIEREKEQTYPPALKPIKLTRRPSFSIRYRMYSSMYVVSVNAGGALRLTLPAIPGL